MDSIKSNYCKISVSELKDIEAILSHKYGTIVRWAIVGVYNKMLKITFSYR